ncbi:MAG: hypothetical protein LBE13_23425 [Bacteroidales bacterium]|nr:hypothetical protein [Bacteroidales bacterium]
MNNTDLLKSLNELFGSYRAEWLRGEIFNFFTEPSYFVELKGNRPCVLQGGRGTGKTTVLRGLSYQGQYALYNNTIEKFDKNNFIGIYHRVNTNHVRAFIGGSLNDIEWQKIFGHYFNLIICREILFFIKWHKETTKNDEVFSQRICTLIAKSIHILTPCENLEVLLQVVEEAMYEFQSQINNISKETKLQLSMPGDPIRLITECATSLPQFKNKMFYILIDEYENYTDYQQQCLNSLIKHNTELYTFKIGVRELGWRIKNTLNEEESLLDPADYVLINIEQKFTEGDYFNGFAKEVCQQRIKELSRGDKNEIYLLEKALAAMSMEEEAEKLGVKKSVFIDKISMLSLTDRQLIEDLPLLYQFFIAYWAETHGKTLEDMIADYKENKTEWDTRYENYKYSILFKIKKGRGKVGIQKYYAGWNTFIKLANGNIRYLMELVYRTYEKHLTDENELSASVSPENQTRAAQEVGLKNLKELEGLCKNGTQLVKLLLGFGRIFGVLISEGDKVSPEINQISIKGEIRQETVELLRDAVMYLAFVRIPGNKLRDDSATRDFMYAIHPIYAPYFVFSYRKKRVMEISENEFLDIISKPEETIGKILKKRDIFVGKIKELPEQLTLFREFYEND